MNKRIFSILLVMIILFGSVFALAGCGKKEAKKVDFSREELEKKADVMVSPTTMVGGDCIEYTNYYISYSDSKLYTYHYFQKVPLETVEEDEKSNYEAEITVMEYELSKKQVKELKEFFESEHDRRDGAKYKIRAGDKVYEIEKSKKFESIIKDITK